MKTGLRGLSKYILMGLSITLLSSCILFPDPIFVISSTSDYQISNTSFDYSDTEPIPGYPDKIAPTYTYRDFVNNNAYALSCAPSLGEPKLLIIPIWFTDSSSFISESKKEDVRSDIEKVYFGSEEDTGWESVSSYYEKDSFGNCHLSGTVSKWYNVNASYTKYRVDTDKLVSTRALVKDAVEWYKEEYNVSSLTDYDYDNDGYLDGVMLIYAAPDYRAMKENSYKNLWAFCYWIQDRSLRDEENPGPNAFFWASYDFMYGGSNVYSRTGGTYAGGDTTHSTLDAHTYIHEMGHVFGLVDYYDYTNQTEPAAGFSMQDCNVGGHDPFSRLSLGWIRPYVVTNSITMDLRVSEGGGDIILLSPNYNGSPFDEYILIEFYSPMGLNLFDSAYMYMNSYPKGPSTYGVRVWHVDARLYSNSLKKLVTEPTYGSQVKHATSNSRKGSSASEDYSEDAAGSTEYNILQLIRSDYLTTTYRSNSDLNAGDLFYTGYSFSMNKYSKQFVNSTKLNSGLSLGWSFSIGTLTTDKVTITCTKL